MDSRESLDLSQREEDVLALTMTGLADKEIAANVGISVHTVRTYWDRIREKIGKSTRAEVISEIARRLSRDSTVSELESRLADADAKRYHFEKLLGRVPILVWSCDTTGRIIYVNDQFQSYAGDVSGRLVADLFSRITPPELFTPLHEQAVAARQRHGILEAEAPLRRVDGAMIWHLIRETPLGTSLDESFLRIGTATDIQVLHTRERILGERETRTRLAADLADIGIAYYDSATGKTYSNPAYDEMTGVVEVGKDWTDAVHAEDRSLAEDRWRQAVAQEVPLDSEHRYLSADGQDVNAIAKVTSMPGKGWLFLGKRHDRQDGAILDTDKISQVITLLREMLGFDKHSPPSSK